ncbi:hypothetical protein DFH11DRAFT_1152839 [Phellopilus nigrolimitatus]|nr:hypothetical protein DFH11DRAFT_1152839 [Phellopilus nigrolimitatus]
MASCRDKSYYFSLLVFKVEDCLFRVPQQGFESQSEVFKTMFTLPSGEDTEQDGCSDDRPLVLEGIKADDFRAFLKLLYPQFRRPTRANERTLSEEESLVVLSLARMWCFDKIVDITIEGLEAMNLSSARKLELANGHNIVQWYEPELSALVYRKECLTLDEAKQIGLELVVEISNMREEKYRVLPLHELEKEYKARIDWGIKHDLRRIIKQIEDNSLDLLSTTFLTS